MLEESQGRALQDAHGAHAAARINRLADVSPAFKRMGALARRDVRFMLSQQERALRVSDEALADLAEGESGTGPQVQYIAAVRAVFEKWQVLGPEARRFLTEWAPFRWFARSAAQVVAAAVSPRHPAAQALMKAAAGMSETEREIFELVALGEVERPVGPAPWLLQTRSATAQR